MRNKQLRIQIEASSGTIAQVFQIKAEAEGLSLIRSHMAFDILISRHGAYSYEQKSFLYTGQVATHDRVDIHCATTDPDAQKFGTVIENGLVTFYVETIYDNEVIDLVIITRSLGRVILLPKRLVDVAYTSARIDEEDYHFKTGVIEISTETFTIELPHFSQYSKHMLVLYCSSKYGSNPPKKEFVFSVHNQVFTQNDGTDITTGEVQNYFTVVYDNIIGTLTFTPTSSNGKLISYNLYTK